MSVEARRVIRGSAEGQLGDTKNAISPTSFWFKLAGCLANIICKLSCYFGVALD